MKLWILRPREDLNRNSDPWQPWYDKNFGFVIRAETEEEARKLASEVPGDEQSSNPWVESKYSTCKELTTQGNSKVIIKDYASA